MEWLQTPVLIFSMALFFAGYALAPAAYHYHIKWLIAYPLWIAKKLEKWMQRKHNPLLIFLFIFLLNALSLFVDLISAYAPGLPFVLILWTGLNIGVVSFHTLKGNFYFSSLFNPVALFELPAAFLTFTMAAQYTLKRMGLKFTFAQWPDYSLNEYLVIFIKIALPLLFLAGIIETALIHYAQKMDDKQV